MIVESLEFVHLELPFRRPFAHASRTRTSGDTVLVRLTTRDGLAGHGEILPRRYVTGETIGAILGEDGREGEAARLADLVVGRRFADAPALVGWIEARYPAFESATALFGGVELALWNALCRTVDVDFGPVLGPPRDRPVGRCVTLGLELSAEGLRRAAIGARLGGATVAKLKLGRPDDVERLRALDGWLGGRTPIRVDANGRYDAGRAEALLSACAGTTALESFEDPFGDVDGDGDATEAQRRLHARFGVGFVADESLRCLSDARRIVERGAFQAVNLRVGKLGGLYPTRLVRDLAARGGLALVAGSMVGESGVLTQASELLLSRSAGLDYVEGLGQNVRFLEVDPVTRLDGPGPMRAFAFDREACAPLVRRSVTFD